MKHCVSCLIYYFSNAQEKTKEITTVKLVGNVTLLSYNLVNFCFNFLQELLMFEKLYQTLKRVFDVMFKKRAGVFYRDLKPRGAAEWF